MNLKSLFCRFQFDLDSSKEYPIALYPFIFQLILLITISLVSASCIRENSSEIRQAKSIINKNRLQKKHSNTNFFPKALHLPLEERHQVCPDPVLKLLSDWDQRDYKAHTLTHDQKKEFKKCINLLPNSYKRILKESLLGIYFIPDFLTSGYADVCYTDSLEAKCYLVIRPDVFEKSLSQWLSEKENTCFIQDTAEVKISINAGNQYSGLLGILLHESSHIVDYIERFTPNVDDGIRPYYIAHNIPIKEPHFSKHIWEDQKQLSPSITFPDRKNISFYGMNKGPKISLSKAKNIYEQLEQTPFASLYASKLRAEDFAEMAMFYYLTHNLKQPYTIEIFRQNEKVYQYKPLKNPIVLKRVKVLQKHLF